MRIRATTDIDLVEKLHRSIFPVDDFPDDCKHWIAWEDDVPVGFCSAKYVDGENTVFMARAGVLPKYRGNGYHKRMLSVRERWARKVARWAVTYCTYENHTSLASLIKNGWTLYEPARKWADQAHYLQKDLHD